jgi:hypothetical protein
MLRPRVCRNLAHNQRAPPRNPCKTVIVPTLTGARLFFRNHGVRLRTRSGDSTPHLVDPGMPLKALLHKGLRKLHPAVLLPVSTISGRLSVIRVSGICHVWDHLTTRRCAVWSTPACRWQGEARARLRHRVERRTACAHRQVMTSRRRQIASRPNVYGRIPSHGLSKREPERAIFRPDTAVTCYSRSS